MSREHTIVGCDLGRRIGVWIPPEQVELHLNGGWRLLDDGAGFSGDGSALLAPPVQERKRRA